MTLPIKEHQQQYILRRRWSGQRAFTQKKMVNSLEEQNLNYVERSLLAKLTIWFREMVIPVTKVPKLPNCDIRGR